MTFIMILIYDLQAIRILEGIKNRLMRSWRRKRGKIPTRRGYTLEAGTHWDLAVEQMHILLLAKQTDNTSQHEKSVPDNGRGIKRNRNGQNPEGDLDKRSDNSKETVDQHSNKPTIYI